MVKGKATIVAYLRVSTGKQAASGLGLEGQRAAIKEYANRNGVRIVAEYVEAESGRKSDRPEFGKAVSHAKRSKSVLVIAKLDRLARNVYFVSGLLESGVDFIACDNEYANKLTIHVLAAMAEHEAEQISARTKAALAAYKARGGKLGATRKQCRNLTNKARRVGAKAAGESHRKRANEAYSDLYADVAEWNESGMTLQEIADKLNNDGHTTRTGKPWNPTQVMRVAKRAKQFAAA